jgi:sigma-B regulation protein RsbU (phosphoserine phosphatase)
MTLCLLRFTNDGRVQFAGAHEELLVYRAKTGRCDRILTEGIWSGIVPDMTSVTKNQELQLTEGDLLVLYTEGLVESRDIRGHFYSLERLVSEVERSGTLPVTQIFSHLIDTVRSWMSSQQDDLTLVVARYSGNTTKTPERTCR